MRLTKEGLVMRKEYVDLHLHTTNSDGEQTLEQVVEAARTAGMSWIALTDHNYFSIYEPVNIEGLELIPGAEFSTSYEYGTGQKKEIHVLGLFFEGVNRELERVWDCIEKDFWIEAILKVINSLGYPLTMQEVIACNTEAKRLSRNQVAKALVKKEYATDRDDAMDRLIGNRSPYYINPVDYVKYISLSDCVQTIHRYGGIPVLAHPFHYGFTIEQVEELAAYYRSITDGPLAMEVYYSKYSEKEIQYLESLADRYGFLPSVGSDRHKSSQSFARGEKKLLEQMKHARLVGGKTYTDK